MRSKMLEEVVFELCYITHIVRRVGFINISGDEVESNLQKAVSFEVSRFIRDAVIIMKSSNAFSTWRIFLESKMIEYMRNPLISIEELKVIHYSIYIFEYCNTGDLEETVRYCKMILEKEFDNYESIRGNRILNYLRLKDYNNYQISRIEFEDFKDYRWNEVEEEEKLSKEEIQRILRENLKSDS